MLGADALMNMPMMMPMMMGGMDGTMDAHGLLNMPQMPQNGISNGKVFPGLIVGTVQTRKLTHSR